MSRLLPWLDRRRRRLSVSSSAWRFLLLAAVVTASSVMMLDQVLAPAPNDTPGDALGCMLAAGLNPDGYYLDNLRALSRHPEAMADCLRGVPAVEYWKGMVGTLGVLAVAAILYWWLPRWRNRSTLPLEAVDVDGSLRTELAGLTALTGTEGQVHFRVDPTRTTGGAVAYGRAGQYVVALHGGLLTRRHTHPELFRTVVLHELAHVRNRDVGFAYGGIALWRAFTVLAFLPAMFLWSWYIFEGVTGVASSPFWPGTAPMLLRNLVQGLVLVLLVHLARADLLRQRELLADARAVGWGATPAAWIHPDSVVGSAPILRRWKRMLGTHPSWAQRRAALADPQRLRTVGALEMLLTGLASWLLFQRLAVIPGISTGAESVLILVALVAPVFWIAVRRSAEAADGRGPADGVDGRRPVADTADGRGPAAAAGGRARLAIPGVAAGLALGLGLSIGELSRGSGGNEWFPYSPYYLLFFLMVGTVPAVWLAQSDRVASFLPRPGHRGAVRLLGGAVAFLLLWEGLSWWMSVGRLHLAGSNDRLLQDFASSGSEFAWEYSVFTRFVFDLESSSRRPVLAVAVMLTWLLPVLLSALGANVIRRTALVAGAAGALLSWVAIGGAVSIMAGRRSGEVHASREALTALRWWLLVATAVACLVTACVVAAFASEHWMIRALVAAGITHLGSLAGTYVLHAVDGCLGPLNVLTDECRWKPDNGWIGMGLQADMSLINVAFLSACAAVAVGIASRALRPRPLGETVAVHPEHTETVRAERAAAGRRAARWTVAAALVAATVAALLAPFTGPRRESAARSDPTASTSSRLPAPPPAQSALIRTWQVHAWGLHGGYDHMHWFSEQATIISRALGDAAAKATSEQARVKIDTELFLRLCGEVEGRVAQAQRYFPIPDPDAQALWSSALTGLGRGAQECQAAFDGGDGARFLGALDDMIAAMQKLLDMTNRISTIAEGARSPQPE